ncbi:MAG: class I SAM-dependent methyltransferase [Deltaproteobacteria bacterium]|nr:class I SAM-dependent methyltransferase [Deltaproteobacteria bacterium]
MWNEKFDRPDHLYGTEPNDFLKGSFDWIPKPGKVISLGEGEGRNAVFLAQMGYEVFAVDSSSVGLEKTRKLALEKGVQVFTEEADLKSFDLGTGKWDGVVMIFCHLPSSLRVPLWNRISKSLKRGGVLLIELYSPQQLDATRAGRSIGGPKDLDLMVTVDEIRTAFPAAEFKVLRAVDRDIHEGIGHRGPSHTVQVLARL